MKEKFSGELSWEFGQDIQDCVELYSDDKCVIFDKTPAQVSTKTHCLLMYDVYFPSRFLRKTLWVALHHIY